MMFFPIRPGTTQEDYKEFAEWLALDDEDWNNPNFSLTEKKKMSEKKSSAMTFWALVLVFIIGVAAIWQVISAENKAADEKAANHLLDEITPQDYKRLKWKGEEGVPGVAEDIEKALEDGKVTNDEFNKIDAKVKEYNDVKDKYETIQVLQKKNEHGKK